MMIMYIINVFIILFIRMHKMHCILYYITLCILYALILFRYFIQQCYKCYIKYIYIYIYIRVFQL